MPVLRQSSFEVTDLKFFQTGLTGAEKRVFKRFQKLIAFTPQMAGVNFTGGGKNFHQLNDFTVGCEFSGNIEQPRGHTGGTGRQGP